MKSQKEQVLSWLRKGHTLTALQCLNKFGSMRLGAYIYDMRQEYGQDYVMTEMITVKNRRSKEIRVARYSI